MESEEKCKRVRLLFKDKEGILSDSQKSEGFKRCWLLLKPQLHKTIADLTAHVLHAFQLHPSCPHGLLLYMDGFVLPPFEPTAILKDKDIISVRKKGAILSLEGTNATNLLEEPQIVDKQPVKSGPLLLANEEFEKEAGGYLSDEPEDESEEEEEEDQSNESDQEDDEVLLIDNETSKKRKALDEFPRPKKKKQCSSVQESIHDDVPAKQVDNSNQAEIRTRKKQEKESNLKEKTDKDNERENAEICNSNVKTSPKMTGTDQIQKNADEVVGGSGGTPKIPSRSARRKKAKRRWIREMAKIQKQADVSQSEGLQNWKQAQAEAATSQSKGFKSWKKVPAKTEKKKQNDWKQKPVKPDAKEVLGEPKGLLHWKPWSGKDTSDNKRKDEEANQNGIICEQPIQKSDMEDEVVPVVIRPGHIRFEPQEKEQALEQSQVSGEPFQWNGITSKRKGQKWGKEKLPYSKRNEYKDMNKVQSEMLSMEKEIHLNEPIDFDKIPTVSSLPKAGDIIGYRLLELSSSWTPELSSYRVGQVSWCNSESGKMLLVPVSEYPIISTKSNEDEPDAQPDNSLYKEDGSLEIDFSTLVDVRLVKDGFGGPAVSVNGPSGGPENAILSLPSASKDKQTDVFTPENGEAHRDKQKNASSSENGEDIWEQISEALSAKKAELSQENTWGKPASSGKGSWSYRALKGSALGPTMAFLRSKNKL